MKRKRNQGTDPTFYIKYPKNSTRKLIETINNFGKVAGYKINLKLSSLSIQWQQSHWERDHGHTPVNDSIKDNKTQLRRGKTLAMKTSNLWIKTLKTTLENADWILKGLLFQISGYIIEPW